MGTSCDLCVGHPHLIGRKRGGLVPAQTPWSVCLSFSYLLTFLLTPGVLRLPITQSMKKKPQVGSRVCPKSKVIVGFIKEEWTAAERWISSRE